MVVYSETTDELVLENVQEIVDDLRAEGYELLAAVKNRADGNFIEVMSEGGVVARFDNPTISDVHSDVMLSAVLTYSDRFGVSE